MLLPQLRLTTGLLLYAAAMAYLETAVVVYLRAAIGVSTGRIFPIDLSLLPCRMAGSRWDLRRRRWSDRGGGLDRGAQPLERLACGAVIFGIWDIGS